MSVSLEKIDMLMERANISYKEAKEALEKFDGDMVEALIYLESNQKTGRPGRPTPPRPPHPRDARNHHRQQRHDYRQHQTNQRDFFEDLKDLVKRLHKTSFIIGKKGHKLLDLPLTVAALIILVTLPFSIFFMILPYFFGYQILILNPDGSKAKFDDFKDATQEKKEEPQKEASEDRMA